MRIFKYPIILNDNNMTEGPDRRYDLVSISIADNNRIRSIKYIEQCFIGHFFICCHKILRNKYTVVCLCMPKWIIYNLSYLYTYTTYIFYWEGQWKISSNFTQSVCMYLRHIYVSVVYVRVYIITISWLHRACHEMIMFHDFQLFID